MRQGEAVPIALQHLMDQERVYVNEDAARRAHEYFEGLGFGENESENPRTPVEVVDIFDNPVSLSPSN